jgi:hypothetical protein
LAENMACFMRIGSCRPDRRVCPFTAITIHATMIWSHRWYCRIYLNSYMFITGHKVDVEPKFSLQIYFCSEGLTHTDNG